MKMKNILAILCFMVITHFNYSAIINDSDQIEVRLSTKTALEPLYFSTEQEENCAFSKDYIDQLHQVLFFDLSNNGRTAVVGNTEIKEGLAAEEKLDSSWNVTKWKDTNVKYVIKVFFNEKQVNAKLLDLQNNKSKVIKAIKLSGNIKTDRHKIHQIADLAHKAFFGTPGVASTKILYSLRTRNNSQESSKWISEIWECDYDGANQHQITNLNEYAITPAYIPPLPGYSSGSFFYVSYKVGQPKIFIASLKDGIGQRFAYLRGNQLMPAISAKRDKVAFISDVTGNADLFLQNFDPDVGPIGKPRQIFSTPRGTQASPTFSPDGNKIAFVSNKDGTPRIYVIDVPLMHGQLKLADIKASLITKENRDNTSPSWSLDGSKIAYSSMTNGVRQIWYYDFNTDREYQLTNGSSHKENPCWAPDNMHIVFNSSTPFSSELYIVNINIPKAIKISSGDGEKRFPFWEPVISTSFSDK